MSGVIRAIARRPDLWTEGVRAFFSMAPRNWWRKAPFLPIPDGAYLRWRKETAYGTSMHPIEGADIVQYLEWRQRMRRER